MYQCRIEADSINAWDDRLTTVVVTLPRIVLAELNTHRVFSRSSASSRAIPVETMLKRVEEDPFVPFYWGKNQKGMQADEELSEEAQRLAEMTWRHAAVEAQMSAEELLDHGVHKQITNRLLEPFLWHEVIITATEWDNFDHLRANPLAAPEIKRAAELIIEARQKSTPRSLGRGQWHLPFSRPEDRDLSIVEQVFACVGRCARVSYLTHDGKRDPQADIALAKERLLASGHMAPWEHVARPMTAEEHQACARSELQPARALESMIQHSHEASNLEHYYNRERFTYFMGNFQGFIQARKMIPYEYDILGALS